MDNQIPVPVQALLDTYIRFLNQELPGFMTALYLHGSLALDAFDPRFSDIDFIAVVGRRAEAKDIHQLGVIHREVRRKQPRLPMEGIYVQKSDLGGADRVEPFPYYADGKLHASGYHGLNSVTWWVLKNKGICVVGPATQELNFVVDDQLLIREMAENLNTYWAAWAVKPGQKLRLLTDWGIQWSVLGVLRQFYTFREHDITSKVAAGKYALTHLPVEWHRLIHEALAIREGSPERCYSSRLTRAREAVAFVKYTIQACNFLLRHQSLSSMDPKGLKNQQA